ncbi:MAG: ABC transporter permease [Planctomycetota bacterium]
MKYQLFLTRKYLMSRFIPWAAVIAVAFGVFALVTVLSVMEGFKVETRKHIRGSLAHLMVGGPSDAAMIESDDFDERVLAVEHVEAIAPFVSAAGLFKTHSGVQRCMLRGVDPIAEAKVGDFRRYVLRESEVLQLVGNRASQEIHRLPESREPMSDDEVSYLFSLESRRKLAERIGYKGFQREQPPQPVIVGIEAVRAGEVALGQIINISSFSPLTNKALVGNFLVVGAFQMGSYDEDRSAMFLPLRAAQEYLDLYDERVQEYRYTGLSVRLDDYANAEEVGEHIRDHVIPHAPKNTYLGVLTWEDQRRNLLTAVDIEKLILTWIMMLIVGFAGATVFLILTLLVIEKTRDLGVVRSLGATSNGVVGIFLCLGCILVTLGLVIGLVTGWLFVTNINEIHDWIYATTGWRLFPPDIYYFTKIPVAFKPLDLLITLGSANVFGLIGSLIPAIWASRQDPIKALRHE